MESPRVLVVPGGTSIGAVALAHAALHKLVELREQRLEDPDPTVPHTIVALRDPRDVLPGTLRQTATSVREAFPADCFPELAPHLDDPHFFEGVDLIMATSGSTTGRPRLVGLSVEALISSAKATHAALGGPGKWILALPAHHISGAMVLFRAALSDISPQIVDTTNGFRPEALIPALRGATADPGVPGYLSLVPVQLHACLDGPEEVLDLMARLHTVLVGGSGCDPELMEAAERRGIHVVQTYGMTETSGGCVYDGIPLDGVRVRTIEVEGNSRIAISGNCLLTRYFDGETPLIDEGGRRWLLTGDMGRISAGGRLTVLGRADDVIISGGLNVAPAPVRVAVNSMQGVRNSWILPTPDARWGHVVTAAVVPEAPIDEVDLPSFAARLRDHVGSILGRPHAPRRVLLVERLPVLPTGKINRPAVRELAETVPAERQWRR